MQRRGSLPPLQSPLINAFTSDPTHLKHPTAPAVLLPIIQQAHPQQPHSRIQESHHHEPHTSHQHLEIASASSPRGSGAHSDLVQGSTVESLSPSSLQQQPVDAVNSSQPPFASPNGSGDTCPSSSHPPLNEQQHTRPHPKVHLPTYEVDRSRSHITTITITDSMLNVVPELRNRNY